jgi:hypothetical protein
MKQRDTVTLTAVRQALAAIAVAETAGRQAADLSDAEVLAVVATQARQYHETAEGFEVAGRPEQAAAERASAAVLEAYLPAALSDAELDELVRQQIDVAAAEGLQGMKAMGRVVSAVRVAAGPTADGAAIAAKVKSALS